MHYKFTDLPGLLNIRNFRCLRSSSWLLQSFSQSWSLPNHNLKRLSNNNREDVDIVAMSAAATVRLAPIDQSRILMTASTMSITTVSVMPSANMMTMLNNATGTTLRSTRIASER